MQCLVCFLSFSFLLLLSTFTQFGLCFSYCVCERRLIPNRGNGRKHFMGNLFQQHPVLNSWLLTISPSVLMMLLSLWRELATCRLVYNSSRPIITPLSSTKRLPSLFSPCVLLGPLMLSAGSSQSSTKFSPRNAIVSLIPRVLLFTVHLRTSSILWLQRRDLERRLLTLFSFFLSVC